MRNLMVVTCYFGDRRSEYEPYEEDRLYFLKVQSVMLGTFYNELDKVVFAINEDEGVKQPDYEKGLWGIDLYSGKYEIMTRPNVGASYGAVADAFRVYGTDYDNYVLHEDDWVWVKHYWDRELVQIMEDRELDYLCGAYCFKNYAKHAAISEGMIRSSMLAKASRREGQVYQPSTKEEAEAAGKYSECKYGSFDYDQRLFSESLLRAGCQMGDWLDSYRTLFIGGSPDEPMYLQQANPFRNNEDIVMPIQALPLNEKERKQAEFIRQTEVSHDTRRLQMYN